MLFVDKTSILFYSQHVVLYTQHKFLKNRRMSVYLERKTHLTF